MTAIDTIANILSNIPTVVDKTKLGAGYAPDRETELKIRAEVEERLKKEEKKRKKGKKAAVEEKDEEKEEKED